MLQTKPRDGLLHIARAQQFDISFIETLFQLADDSNAMMPAPMTGLILASLFYEESTRTRFSFESAMRRLGGHVIGTENAKQFSSAAKGESIEDTIRVVSHYADIIVLRHDEAGALDRALSATLVPLINAGCGVDQHPTQALLDLHTIKRKCGRTEELTIVFVGDLLSSRTVHSLAYLLGKYRRNRLIFRSPKKLRIPKNITDYLDRHDVYWEEGEGIADGIEDADVIYQTRPQKNRASDPIAAAGLEQYLQEKHLYRVNLSVVERMRKDAIIMHPLPRNDEIAPEVDACPQAVYLDDQIDSGLRIRKALLQIVCGRA